jgi:hypothetical protein
MTKIKQTYQNYLRDGVCEVTFTKENGDIREMRCTTNYDLVPREPDHHETKVVSLAEVRRSQALRDNSNLIQAYDLDKQAWRSFRVDRVNKFVATVGTNGEE